MKKILVTGGAGFIGSNFIRYILDKYSEYQIINLDLLSYAGNIENLTEIAGCRNYKFIRGNICDRELIAELLKENIDIIINFAAESHVDRSIKNPAIFVKTNTLGTEVLLEAAKKSGIEKYIQISTDEVYGTIGHRGSFTEESPLAPNNPYSASKAGADLLVRAYHKTFNLPVIITRSTNNYGPYQHPEKLIPLMITGALRGKDLPVYGDGQQIRDWLHVKDHCAALDYVLHRGKIGEIYNIGANNEQPNIKVIKMILDYLGKPDSLIKYVDDRPGHDRRYSLNTAKIQGELGWTPEYTLESGLRDTIDWYVQNKQWWQDQSSS